MSELQFTRQFLQTLDTRPIKLSSDHVQDPRTLPAQPAYILPRNPHPYLSHPPPTTSAPASTSTSTSTSHPSTTTNSRTLSITLKPLRGAPVTLPRTPLKTSIYDLKTRLGVRTGYEPDKIKILSERRPVGDVKTLSEVLGAAGGVVGDGGVEMGVMYVGLPTREPREEEKGEGEGERDAAAAAAAAATSASAPASAPTERASGKDTDGDTPMTPAPAPAPLPEMPHFLTASLSSTSSSTTFPPAATQKLGSQEFWTKLLRFVTVETQDADTALEACGAFWAGYVRDGKLH